MSFRLPKKYYLIVHDALRKVLGVDAEISAFVSSLGTFQCHMLVNSSITDPDLATRYSASNVGPASVQNPHCKEALDNKKDGNGSISGHVGEFAVKLQRYLGNCDIVVHRHRLDIVFMDREVLRLALGASRRVINNLTHGSDINQEPDWTRRNRLRISLGYDEDLFTNVCDLSINLSARLLEKWAYDMHWKEDVVVNDEASARLQRERALPPVTYWQAHGYSLSSQYPCNHHVTLAGTIAQNFAKYYGEFPFDNPYCPGEDLNTIGCVGELCESWKQFPVRRFMTEVLLPMGNEPVTQK
ncbi:hypothetical protein ERJ75_000833200 [Trypanosoma vivax]|uniref:Uncharacterized protein n=1 Tax=Trypanosoma vivax (strain Y486) TaxID=1055687 RepID=G0TYY6_TRYVY|nr:hypothetical protein TRVL_00128 [Trypanosoma vivax]KAH8612990.1 hypothetical protein ERJ75_000833200 [Trypanosoma vivax]CCC49189.1 conserved hypothetical protein [Trypanosoma vivax Y486]